MRTLGSARCVIQGRKIVNAYLVGLVSRIMLFLDASGTPKLRKPVSSSGVEAGRVSWSSRPTGSTANAQALAPVASTGQQFSMRRLGPKSPRLTYFGWRTLWRANRRSAE